MKQIHYQEEQRFTQWWLWTLLLGIALPICHGLYQQLYLGKPYGSNPASNPTFIGFGLLYAGILWLFYVMRLRTKVTDKKIIIHFYPFLKREFLKNGITTAKVLKYGFVGGWGIRYWTKYGTVYNVKGNKGLYFKMNNGDKYLIGTQHPIALKKVLKALSWPIED
ncbi:hypothetical protein [Flavobacterium sp. ASW18X]|uniref:hypothetical protein n=1 Tax=Flavobacterium sp. ASW18X TaxID=2572595 RepID=UPI0010ADD31A|nr:hypothetical protein [Flavobacterium sp. ASW18X]TKD56544.1 hypothetical protein FBT53_15575 [Flavobacterium sp. ASW18X]